MKRDDEDLEAYWEQRAMMDSLDDGDPWETYQDGFDDETFVEDDTELEGDYEDDEEYYGEGLPDEDY